MYNYVNFEYKSIGMQFVGPYYTYDLRFNCPVPKPLPPYLNMFKAWSPSVWALVLSCWALVCLLQTALASRSSGDHSRNLLKIYGSQLGVCKLILYTAKCH